MAFWILVVYLFLQDLLKRIYALILHFHRGSSVTLLKFLILSKGHGLKMPRYHINLTAITHSGLNAEHCPWAEITPHGHNIYWHLVSQAKRSVSFYLIMTRRIIWAFEKVIVCGRGLNIRDWLFHLPRHDPTSFTGPQPLWLVEMSRRSCADHPCSGRSAWWDRRRPDKLNPTFTRECRWVAADASVLEAGRREGLPVTC